MTPPEEVRAWLDRYGAPDVALRARLAPLLARAQEGSRDTPLFSILVPVHAPETEALRAMAASVRAQTYPRFELILVDDASPEDGTRAHLDAIEAEDPARIRTILRATNGHISRATRDALAAARGDVAVLLDHDDRLAPDALALLALTLDRADDALLLYSDEAMLGEDGRPYLFHCKPRPNIELLRCQNYINHLCAIRMDLVRALGGPRVGYEGSQDHDLVLRAVRAIDAGFAEEADGRGRSWRDVRGEIAAGTDAWTGDFPGPADGAVPARRRARIRRIAKPLYEWRAHPGGATFSHRAAARAAAAARRAVQDDLDARGEGGCARPGPHGFHRVERAFDPATARIAVLIPTRDAGALLGVCLRGLFTVEAGADFALVLIDNGTVEAKALDVIRQAKQIGAHIVRDPSPFNFSALVNQGAAAAKKAFGADFLLLLNNDVTPMTPGWMGALAAQASRDGVGAVGAALFHPEGTFQHAGVVVGAGGAARHPFHGVRETDGSYFARASLAHEAGAVTGACLMTSRAAFEAVGGLDEETFPIAFNDVDYCLKLRAQGLRVIYEPAARLTHLESATRGEDGANPEKRARLAHDTQAFFARWGTRAVMDDPAYSPNLALFGDLYRPAFPPWTMD